ncbi:LPS export ABC transporter periplasmic protein LptC [Rufibacter latericius]|uniref:LPS export ABC transporter periplasmic protein LptC n=1 Tax=Rufibacter latericius TaxID=2487040 RepID=A0A3M9MN40_9BACT|nr:LPS export ABC transporter periplasmic protein LptC [Rufibacter latericius]RNI26956.1 LPS export ABC transporter periplasmic protein LptC [Rufibacter latericius]
MSNLSQVLLRKQGWRNPHLFWVLFLACFSWSCQKADENIKPIQYNGPTSETYNQVTIYSDSAQMKLKLSAPVEQQLQNGDIIYTKGMYITFYEENKPTTIITAKYGRYDKAKDQYVARNDVVVKNIVKNEQLNTEELFWERQKQSIFTDKFVRITSTEEVVTGVGLTAKQDFSDYTLKQFSGSFVLKQ